MRRASNAQLARLPAILALLLAAGCARRSEPPLRFWAMGREGEVVEERVREFERESGIRVEVQQIPWSAAHEKLITSFVGQSTPDVAQLGNTWVSEFTALHSLEPLDARVLHSAEVHPQGYFPGIWDTNVIDGKLRGIPWYVDTRVLFYRRDLLKRAGYDSIPGTWQGWRQAMEAVRRLAGPGKYAIFAPANQWNVPVILGLQRGSPLLVDDDTRAAFSDTSFRRAFEFYASWYRDRLAPPLTNNEIANLYDEFARATFSMYVSGPWDMGEFSRRLPPSLADAWETAPMPGPDGESSRLSLAGGSSLVIFHRSRRQDDAWKLIEFLSRPEQQVAFYHACGDLPARREAWADSALAVDRHLHAFRIQLERAVPTPKVPEWEQIANRLQDYAERVARGASPVDSALAGLDRDVDRMLEKRRWLVERARHASHAGFAP
ncbi:MAG TPA: extracellular solute-binding protein [Candidatus Sulfotelmatobacter sp.]|nr:extracellular solute-binding protein [Candidatus Sulfotelmatobacter sp.]